ncbi:hypothetical protein CBL17_18200 [Shigella sonnei]|nr:hypothetical protein CBL17_18200 [Shigella sonnei]
MNKIYSLKYSHITGGLVAVSELTRKVSVGTSRKKLSSVLFYPQYMEVMAKQHLQQCWI